MAQHLGDGHNIVFFLGAGCSRAAGIPTGEDMMAQWVRDGAPKKSFVDMAADRYPTAAGQSAAFRTLCAGKQPTAGHHALARLFAAFPSQIRLCITTNFDGLVETAVQHRNGIDGNTNNLRVHSDHSAGAGRPAAQHLAQRNVFVVVKLHGDAGSEVRVSHKDIPTGLVDALRTELQKVTLLVFLGYGGNEHNVASWLSQLPVEENGVMWFSAAEPNTILSPWLRGRKYTHVAHQDFDTALAALGNVLMALP